MNGTLSDGKRTGWLFFVSAVWLFIALNGYKVIEHLLHADSIIGGYPAGYDMRVMLAPFFLFFFELFLWFRHFRWRRHPARLFAGIIGIYICLMVVFVSLVVADLYGRDVPAVLLWLYAYSGAGHLTYAVFGRDHHF